MPPIRPRESFEDALADSETHFGSEYGKHRRIKKEQSAQDLEHELRQYINTAWDAYNKGDVQKAIDCVQIAKGALVSASLEIPERLTLLEEMLKNKS